MVGAGCSGRRQPLNRAWLRAFRPTMIRGTVTFVTPHLESRFASRVTCDIIWLPTPGED